MGNLYQSCADNDFMQFGTRKVQLTSPNLDKTRHCRYNDFRGTKKRGDGVKITIHEQPDLQEIEVRICCARETEAVQRLAAGIRTLDDALIGRSQKESFRLELNRILYIESVDRRTFLYTAEQSYETDKRLCELERCLQGKSFFRVSKSAMINLRRVRSIRPEIGARLLVTMDNGERIVVSRQYAGSIKTALGVW